MRDIDDARYRTSRKVHGAISSGPSVADQEGPIVGSVDLQVVDAIHELASGATKTIQRVGHVFVRVLPGHLSWWVTCSVTSCAMFVPYSFTKCPTLYKTGIAEELS